MSTAPSDPGAVRETARAAVREEFRARLREELRGALGLPAPVPDVRRRYRQAACLLASFDPARLRLPGEAAPTGRAAVELAADCTAVGAGDADAEWSLVPEVREEALRSLAGPSEALALLEANAAAVRSGPRTRVGLPGPAAAGRGGSRRERGARRRPVRARGAGADAGGRSPPGGAVAVTRARGGRAPGSRGRPAGAGAGPAAGAAGAAGAGAVRGTGAGAGGAAAPCDGPAGHGARRRPRPAPAGPRGGRHGEEHSAGALRPGRPGPRRGAAGGRRTRGRRSRVAGGRTTGARRAGVRVAAVRVAGARVAGVRAAGGRVAEVRGRAPKGRGGGRTAPRSRRWDHTPPESRQWDHTPPESRQWNRTGPGSRGGAGRHRGPGGWGVRHRTGGAGRPPLRGARLSLPFAYVDFERPSLSVHEPVTLVTETARQLAVQFPAFQDELESLAEEGLRLLHSHRAREERVAELSRLAATRGPGRQSSREFLAEAGEQDCELFRRVARVLRRAVAPRHPPFVLVIDSFEEAQYRWSPEVGRMWALYFAFHDAYPAVRVVVSGRAPVGHPAAGHGAAGGGAAGPGRGRVGGGAARVRGGGRGAGPAPGGAGRRASAEPASRGQGRALAGAAVRGCGSWSSACRSGGGASSGRSTSCWCRACCTSGSSGTSPTRTCGGSRTGAGPAADHPGRRPGGAGRAVRGGRVRAR